MTGQFPLDTAPPPPPSPPPKPKARTLKKWHVLASVFIVWVLTLVLAYGATSTSLGTAIFLVFLFGFPVPTFIFFAGRHVISKPVVKALDYLTILTFLTGIVAVAEIDIKTFKDRADIAASQIGGMQQLLQQKLDAQTKACDNLEIKPQYDPNVRSRAFIRSFVYCYLLSDLRGVNLDQVSEEQLSRIIAIAHVANFFILPDDSAVEILNGLSNYEQTRALIKPPNPIGIFIPKTVAYLLVAFAFAVRLTRTTLEVFEWHT
jgi:hypothetical protein